ncbi:MAG: trehalose-phosphatase [Candidatus Cyclobacteriaceae bacterium M3_2C_046]
MNFNDLPWLNDHLEQFFQQLNGQHLALFLDYDGTLTPIVDNPEDAHIPSETKYALKELADLCTLAVVSGRDRNDVINLVGLEELIYSGSHGFDTSGPDMHMQHQGGKNCLPDFDQAEHELKEKLASIPGAKVERKLFALAIHYRHVADNQVDEFKQTVDQVFNKYDSFKKAGGKKIIEFKPNIDWHKGKAVLWLLDKLNLNQPEVLKVYIGDDLTDEDAFSSLKDIDGMGILVGDHEEETFASYKLNDTFEVQEFLNQLKKYLKNRRSAN